MSAWGKSNGIKDDFLVRLPFCMISSNVLRG